MLKLFFLHYSFVHNTISSPLPYPLTYFHRGVFTYCEPVSVNYFISFQTDVLKLFPFQICNHFILKPSSCQSSQLHLTDHSPPINHFLGSVLGLLYLSCPSVVVVVFLLFCFHILELISLKLKLNFLLRFLSSLMHLVPVHR